jgi:hypothetical protein
MSALVGAAGGEGGDAAVAADPSLPSEAVPPPLPPQEVRVLHSLLSESRTRRRVPPLDHVATATAVDQHDVDLERDHSYRLNSLSPMASSKQHSTPPSVRRRQ